MRRRDFFRLLAAGSLAASFPPAIETSRADATATAADSGSPRSFPVSDWDAVVNEGFGTRYDQAGPGTWDGVPLRAPSLPDLAGEGPFKPEWPSLLNYEAPEWYRDAKFGIWAHWSPQCVPEDGDWYARKMYIQGEGQYEYHLHHYNHPSKSGYKELCAQWTLLDWEPDALIERYQRAGARFFLALANHHDGFDTWNSRYHAWNAQNIGPRRDVIGGWAAAARKRGLPMGVTVHGARNWWWFQVSHLCDKTGPLAGVPYDGHLTRDDGKGQWWEGYDPQQLYCRKHGIHENPDEAYVRNFYHRVRDLIDQHDPDLLYFDNGGLPLGWAGMNLAAYFYNHNIKTRGGKRDGVITIKHVPANLARAVVADYERSVTGGIMPCAWQSETCIGDWHYSRARFVDHSYMKPEQVIHWMADVVSKNGTFVLNIPGKPDGTNDADEIAVLDAVGDWMRVNGEAIYATRPWKTFGEGPHAAKERAVSGKRVAMMSAEDIRFTRSKRGDVVYAIVLGWPEGDFSVKSLGAASAVQPGKVLDVEMLGCREKLAWNQSSGSLTVRKPVAKPCNFASAFKVTLA